MRFVIAEQLLLSAMLVVPALALLYKHRLFPKMHSAWLFLICCLIVYLLILANVYLIDIRLDAELDVFDLNRDGFFSDSEITPSQKAAMDRVVSDTGRQFAPFTGVIRAPLYVAFSFGLVKMISMVRGLAQRYSSRRTQ